MKKCISVFLLLVFLLSAVQASSFADEPRNASTSWLMKELDSRGIAYTVSQAEGSSKIDLLVFSVSGKTIPQIVFTCHVGSGIIKCTVEDFAHVSADNRVSCLIDLNSMNLNFDTTRFYTTEASDGDYLVSASYTAVIDDEASALAALDLILMFMRGNVESAYVNLSDLM